MWPFRHRFFFFFFLLAKKIFPASVIFFGGSIFRIFFVWLRGCAAAKKKILLKGKETNLVYPAQSIPPLVIMYQHRILLSSFSPLFMEGGTHLGAAGTTA